MSATKTTVVTLFLHAASCLVPTLLASPAHAAPDLGPCAGDSAATATIAAGQTVRGYAETLVHVEAASAGILSLDLLVPADDRARGRVISGARADGWALERSARHRVLAVPAAGSWMFRVAAEDSQQELGIWRLHTGFVPATITEEHLVDSDGRPMLARKLTFHAAGDAVLALVTVVVQTEGKTEEQEIDPDPRASAGCASDPAFKTEEQEIDPDPFAGWNVFWFRVPSTSAEMAPLAEHRIADPSCRLQASDDHGDTPGCATALVAGQELRAELGNGWGDDVDVFAFTLREPRTVRFETHGAADTSGTLIDRYGHRLASNDDSGTGGGFRLVKVLPPGRYYLEIEGSVGAEGAYDLAFAAERF